MNKTFTTMYILHEFFYYNKNFLIAYSPQRQLKLHPVNLLSDKDRRLLTTVTTLGDYRH